MKTILVTSIILAFLSTSCCTLLNQRTTEVNIYSDVDSAVFSFGPDYEKYILPVTLELPRSKYDFYCTVEKDSLKRSVILENKLSPMFWWGNMFSGPGMLGYLVDLTNQKRFTYPADITVPFNSSPRSRAYWKWIQPVKGQLTFKLALPSLNFLYLVKMNGYGSSFGIFGLSAGFEYYLSDKYSVAGCLGTLASMDFVEDYSDTPPSILSTEHARYYSSNFVDERESATSRFFDLKVGTDIQSFHVDVGLQANITRWNYYTTILVLPYFHQSSEIHRLSFNAGAALSCYYRVSEVFNLGMNFYPSLISIVDHNAGLAYTQQGNFELIWKFRIYRPRSKTAGYRMPYRP